MNDVRIEILNDIAKYIENVPQTGMLDTIAKMEALANVVDLRRLLEEEGVLDADQD